MVRAKTTISTDLSAANTNRRQKTGMHGTSNKGTGRGQISKLKNDAISNNAIKMTIPISKCRMFPYNDRILEGLNLENCRSLIDDINAQSQLQPVVARKNPEGDTDYEIIFGTRRYFSCHHTRDKVITMEVVEADDKQAYKIMRSENDERDDTSAYEKSINAKRVITEIYGGSQKNYCQENNINEATLSGWVAISDMAPEITSILPSMYDVSVKQAMKLRSVMNKANKAKKAVLDKAIEIKSTDITTAAILKVLIATGVEAMKSKVKGAASKEYAVAGDKKGVVVKRATSGTLSIKVSKNAAEDAAGVLKVLTAYMSG